MFPIDTFIVIFPISMMHKNKQTNKQKTTLAKTFAQNGSRVLDDVNF